MIYRILLLSFLFLIGLTSLPQGSQAFTVTQTSARQVSDTVALYTIEYVFGARSNDLYLPREAMAGLLHTDQSDRLGYQIIRDLDRPVSFLKTTGLIVSDAAVKDNLYHIPVGTEATFTLIVRAETAAATRDADYVVQVTSLPYYVGQAKQRRAVNEVILRNFSTAGVELNIAGKDTIRSATHTLMLRR